jgi:hypothetical protein
MSADGNWNITMDTPMGSQPATLTLATSGSTLTGTQSAMGSSVEIFDGTANGNDLAWKVNITQPMPMTLEFTGSVDGTKISGQMKAGAFGSWPFSGDKA